MSQRHSEYRAGDEFYTPDWVTGALLAVETFSERVWEPFPGQGHMARALRLHGYTVHEGGLVGLQEPINSSCDIVTNPPYSNSTECVRQALEATRKHKRRVAMLLPHGWDTSTGKRDGRQELLSECSAFAIKLTLLRRIRWEGIEQKKNGPSGNHAWFIWNWKHEGPPRLAWVPA